MPAVRTAPLVTGEQFQRFAELIYDRTGVRMSPQKRMLLSNRLRRRLRALELGCYNDYYALLKKLPQSDAEWDSFLQEITTHETYLFRDPNHWKWFREEYLKQIAAEARRGERPQRLSVWSGACSTGDEAATIACCIAADLPEADRWKVRIVGSDIGVDAVAKATAAAFNQRSMRLVSTDVRRRYFDATGNDIWTLKPALRQWCSFQQHNLLSAWRGEPFDLVFLKNVLIYFDAESKRTALTHIERALASGGYLVTGPAEGVKDPLPHLTRIHSWLRRKDLARSRPLSLAKKA